MAFLDAPLAVNEAAGKHRPPAPAPIRGFPLRACMAALILSVILAGFGFKTLAGIILVTASMVAIIQVISSLKLILKKGEVK
jgi:hypothetical protein